MTYRDDGVKPLYVETGGVKTSRVETDGVKPL